MILLINMDMERNNISPADMYHSVASDLRLNGYPKYLTTVARLLG